MLRMIPCRCLIEVDTIESTPGWNNFLHIIITKNNFFFSCVYFNFWDNLQSFFSPSILPFPGGRLSLLASFKFRACLSIVFLGRVITPFNPLFLRHLGNSFGRDLSTSLMISTNMGVWTERLFSVGEKTWGNTRSTLLTMLICVKNIIFSNKMTSKVVRLFVNVNDLVCSSLCNPLRCTLCRTSHAIDEPTYLDLLLAHFGELRKGSSGSVPNWLYLRPLLLQKQLVILIFQLYSPQSLLLLREFQYNKHSAISNRF